MEPVITTETWHHPSGHAQIKIRIHGQSAEVVRVARKLLSAIGAEMPRSVGERERSVSKRKVKR